MKKLLGLTTISLVAAASIYAADSIESAFAKGKTTGELSIYTESRSNGGTTKDTGYTVGSLYLNYATDSVAGLKATFGVRANSLFGEKNNGDYNDAVKSAITEANLAYTNGAYTVIAGRQPIALEWIGDYHNGIVGVAALDKLTLIAGFTNSKAEEDADTVASFNKFNGNNGAYVVDATYAINDSTKVGAYFMDAKNIFSALGGKVEASAAGVGIAAKYASTKEDAAGAKDGSIMALDLGYEVSGIKLRAGYVATGQDNGAGSITALGDNINPLDSTASAVVYTADAKTMYYGVSTSVAGFDLGALYGTTDYAASKTQKEINITATKEVAKNFKASLLVASVDAQANNDDSNYMSFKLAYSF